MDPKDLVEIRAIETLKYRYLRCLDLKLWEEMGETLVEEATASFAGGALSFEGRPAIIDFLRRVLGTQLTSHKSHHPEIELIGPEEATGVWALDDVVIDPTAGYTVRGAAFYSDRYVRRDGRWLIAHTGYRRVYEEVEARRPGDQGGPTVTADWWATDGRSQLRP